jgi:enterochelin esterase-like enzyme
MNRLIELAEINGTPIIEGEQVTFVWNGVKPPQLVGDFTDWERGKPLDFERYGVNSWYRSIKFPLDAYLEYIFVRDGCRVLDPLNSRLTPNGVGRYNHYFYMPKYKPTMLATRWRDVPRGSTTRVSIPTWELVGGNKRKVHFYSPAIVEPTPLLVVLDGQDYLLRAHLPIIVDNLIAQNRIIPISLAMIESIKQTRIVEYGCSEGNLAFISEVVLPLARERLNLIDVSEYPGAYGILGASMGGLMALYAGLRLSEIFGKILIQSGGYNLGNRDLVVFDLVRYGVSKNLMIWMDVGRFDFQFLLDANQRMYELFQGNGYNVVYREYNAGHNYPAWRDEIDRGLVHLFGV